jgi:hypothetical protein
MRMVILQACDSQGPRSEAESAPTTNDSIKVIQNDSAQLQLEYLERLLFCLEGMWDRN